MGVGYFETSKNIKATLDEFGYPFKSKDHSDKVCIYQNSGYTKTAERYLHPSEDRKKYGCPKILMYQFTPDFKLKVSKKCCDKMKKEPLHKWQKENNKIYGIVGIMHDEGGARLNSNCLAFKSNGMLKNFQPLVAITKIGKNGLLIHTTLTFVKYTNHHIIFRELDVKDVLLILIYRMHLILLKNFSC